VLCRRNTSGLIVVSFHVFRPLRFAYLRADGRLDEKTPKFWLFHNVLKDSDLAKIWLSSACKRALIPSRKGLFRTAIKPLSQRRKGSIAMPQRLYRTAIGPQSQIQRAKIGKRWGFGALLFTFLVFFVLYFAPFGRRFFVAKFASVHRSFQAPNPFFVG
jgi:hypothetical protein